MRWGTKFKRTNHAPETLIDSAFWVTSNIEGLVHDFRFMVPHSAAGEFYTVAYRVILEGLNRQGILRFECVHTPLRHGKWIVRKFYLTFVVALKHREVDDPAKLVHIVIDKPEVLAELCPEQSRKLWRDQRFVTNKKHGIARANITSLAQLGQLLWLEKFCDRPLYTLFAPHQVS